MNVHELKRHHTLITERVGQLERHKHDLESRWSTIAADLSRTKPNPIPISITHDDQKRLILRYCLQTFRVVNSPVMTMEDGPKLKLILNEVLITIKLAAT